MRAAQILASDEPAFYPDEAERGRQAGGAATKRKGRAHYQRISRLGVEARRRKAASAAPSEMETQKVDGGRVRVG